MENNKINKVKIWKITAVGVVTLLLLIIIKDIGVEKYYLNGNSEDNIKRSIVNMQNGSMKGFENISTIKKIQFDDRFLMFYKNGRSFGVAEFLKKDNGDYKISSIETGNENNVNTLISSSINNDESYFVLFGNGGDVKYGRMDVGINNNYVTVNIPNEMFMETIHLNPYADGDGYYYTYKYYDKEGKLIEK